MSINSNLIFDIGVHQGHDAAYYLAKGYEVVAVDADPDLIESNRKKFAADVTAGRLKLLNAAVAHVDGEELPFYRNEGKSHNSLIESAGARHNKLVDVIRVKTRSLRSLIQEFGVPFYCKVDIEGYDEVAIQSLQGQVPLPLFVSAEAEYKSESERLDEVNTLNTLHALADLGYKKFKLVDQASLRVLGSDDFFRRKETLAFKVVRKIQKMTGGYTRRFANRELLAREHHFPLAEDISGPFGKELGGEWCDYEAAQDLYIRHRRSFYAQPSNLPFPFWVDWHATQ